MQRAVDSIRMVRRHEPEGLRRMMTMSFGIHVAVVIALFAVPRDWFAREKPEPIRMVLQMGSPGERTGGLNAAGAQPVEAVAPPPKRPPPIPTVAPPKASVIAVPAKTPPKTPPPPAKTAATTTPTTRPPVTGAQVAPGTAASATGATGQTTGLAMGGGAGGTLSALDTNFCCPEYGEELSRRIRENWQQVQPESGTTIVSFVIRRDGSFSEPEIVQSSGSELLDIQSKAVFRGLKLPPLPEKYPGQTLTVRLKLEYKR